MREGRRFCLIQPTRMLVVILWALGLSPLWVHVCAAFYMNLYMGLILSLGGT
ncbi:hypothetical protein HU200_067643 [Digitaria exilis]|uniref:Uncharacterized protein n=1 Tax=Digitaria exilis TaxID=1010633 RepID=A0A835A4W7_9POAL|nr:hypothetical protein HU200_067643 [Digitaria exilis]